MDENGAARAESELVREFLATRDVACPKCGYNLRGLAGSVCPECQARIQLDLAGRAGIPGSSWLLVAALAGASYCSGYVLWNSAPVVLRVADYSFGRPLWEIALRYGTEGLASLVCFITGLFAFFRLLLYRGSLRRTKAISFAHTYLCWFAMAFAGLLILEGVFNL